MKIWIYIIGFGVVMAVMGSCKPSARDMKPDDRPCRGLKEIDSLMWQRSDSALSLMIKFAASPKADSLDELNSHYCQLLISELLYKNYYRQSNRKDLLKAVDYFDSTNNVFLSARGHYINGVGYYELDSVTEACAEYLMALEIMENHFKATELTGTKAIFMFLTFNRLLSLFSSQFMMDPAITCGEQALAYCQKEPSLHKEIPNTYFHIGKQYDLKGIKDVASDYYGRAIEFLDTSTLIYRDAVSMKALCDYQMGLSTEQSLNTIKQTLSNAEGGKEKMSRFVAIGAIFLNEGIYDSAQYYFETVYMEETSPMIKKGIAESLRNVYDSIGNRERSDECMRYLAEHKKPEGENKAMISQLGDKYMTYIGQKQKRQAEEDRKRSLKKYVEFFISLLFSIVLAIIILTKRKERKLLKHQEEAMENEQHAHRMAQAAMSGKLKHKNKEVLDLKNQIRQYDNDPTKKTVTATSFVEEPVCRLIMKRVTEGRFKSKVDYLNYKDSALTKQELLELRLDADHHFNQFTSRLKKAYPELTNSDLDYCCLYLLGLSDADIAALMQRAYNTVTERNGKIRRILGCESSLPITLIGIAKKPLSI